MNKADMKRDGRKEKRYGYRREKYTTVAAVFGFGIDFLGYCTSAFASHLKFVLLSNVCLLPFMYLCFSRLYIGVVFEMLGERQGSKGFGSG